MSNRNFKILIIGIIGLSLVLGFFSGVLVNQASSKLETNVVHASNQIQDLQDGDLSFRGVAKKTLPSIVQIETLSIQKVKSLSIESPFEFFFRKPNEEKKEKQEQEYKTPGLGSGIIIAKKGTLFYILTNNHVIESANEIKIVTNDDKSYDAKLVGADARTDVAVLSVDTKDSLIVAEIGDSDLVEVGDLVFAVGSPLGYMSTFTQGVVSAKGRKGPANILSDFIQTDAAINRGNSGGALVDIKGRVIGVNTWIASRTGENAGLGFAIPINVMMKRASSLIDSGKVEYGWLGINISDASEDFLDENKLKSTTGAFVHNIYIGSPADKGGLKPGDFIIDIDDTKIKDSDSLVRIVADFKAGESRNFKFYRAGKLKSAKVKIGVRDAEDKINNQTATLWPGIAISQNSDDIAKYFGIDKNVTGVVVIRIEKDSKFDIGGLKAGDVITTINDKNIKNISDFYNAISDDSNRFSIEYIRKGNKFFVGIKK